MSPFAKHFLTVIFLLGVANITDVHCEQVTLLTTEGTTTDLKWEVHNRNEPAGFNGWEDLSIPYKDGIVRGYQVCQINIDPGLKTKPQAWLLLPKVDINGASRIFIEMNFTMRECSDLEKTCRETFSVYHRLANNNKTSRKEKFDTKLFKKIDTVAAEVRFSSSSLGPTSSWNSLINSETVSISFDNSTKTASLQIAIVDAGACIALMGVRIYHKVCRSTVAGFANFKETKTGMTDTSLVPVTGVCVPNSIYLDPESPSSDTAPSPTTLKPPAEYLIGPLFHCTSSGDWQVQTGSCQCEPGHQPDENKTKCVPCASGTYKPLTGNHNCIQCPVHSSSTTNGAQACQCDPGYDFVEEKIVEDLTNFDLVTISECDLCSKLPTSPSELKISEITKEDPGHIQIHWKRPDEDGGCSKVQYCILCQSYPLDGGNKLKIQDSASCDHLQFHPSRCYNDHPKVSVKGLRGHTVYNFTSVALTLATKQKFPELLKNLMDEAANKEVNSSSTGRLRNEELQHLLQSSSISVTHTTSDTLPSSVRDPTIMMENQTAVFFKWKEPEQTNGLILYYKVKYALVYESKDNPEKPSASPARIITHKYTWEEVTVNETKALLTNLFPGSTYEIVITAHNSAGSDNGSLPLQAYTVPFEDETDGKPTHSDNFPYLVATIVIATLVVLICVVLILQWKCRSRKKKQESESGISEQPTEFRPYNSHHETLDQRTYVDPFSLDGLAPHRFLCETSAESITCEQVIGCGEFGEVYKGTLATIDLKTGQETTIEVAVKQLRDQCEPQEQINFLREAMSLEKFHHSNIVHLEAVVTKSRPFFIVTELMDHGCLLGFLKRIKERAESQTNGRGWSLPIPHTMMSKMLRGVASGMEYLCGRGYVHRDLAARNVLVDSDLVCKVADFGLMREADSDESEEGFSGNGTYTTRGGKIAIRWTAPEAIAFRTFTQFSDVWSFGILMWEAANFGEKPYWDLTNHEVIKAVSDGMRLPAPEKCPAVFHQLMLECWRDHHNRPTFTEIVAKFDKMTSDVLEIPASPASCGLQEMFFGEEEVVVDVADVPSENPDVDDEDEEDETENVSDPLLTVKVDKDITDSDDFEPANRDEEEGSEVSSCTSTICASEVTVCAGNGVAIYVPLVRSDSDEIRPITPTRNYYSLTR